MPKYYEGTLLGEGLRFGIVVGRFNEFITQRLLSGALDALKRHGVEEEDIEVAWVPGAFEIPVVTKRLVAKNWYDAIICLGAIIRGDTPHFEFVSAEAAKGVSRVSLDTGTPVIFGVITAETLEQAIERAGSKAGNKGWQAAANGIEMANLLRKLEA